MWRMITVMTFGSPSLDFGKFGLRPSDNDLPPSLVDMTALAVDGDPVSLRDRRARTSYLESDCIADCRGRSWTWKSRMRSAKPRYGMR